MIKLKDSLLVLFYRLNRIKPNRNYIIEVQLIANLVEYLISPKVSRKISSCNALSFIDVVAMLWVSVENKNGCRAMQTLSFNVCEYHRQK